MGTEKRQVKGVTVPAEVEDCRCLSLFPPASPFPAVLGASFLSGVHPPSAAHGPPIWGVCGEPGAERGV